MKPGRSPPEPSLTTPDQRVRKAPHPPGSVGGAARILLGYLTLAAVVALLVIPLAASSLDAQSQRRVDTRTTLIASSIERTLTASTAIAVAATTTVPDHLPGLTQQDLAARLDPIDQAGLLGSVTSVSLVQSVDADDLPTWLDTLDPEVRAQLDLRLSDEPRYRIVTHIWPLEANRAVPGIDVTVVPPVADAAERALRSTGPAAAGPYRLMQDAEGQFATVVLVRLGDSDALVGVGIRHQELFDDVAPIIDGLADEVVHLDTDTVVARGGDSRGSTRLRSSTEVEVYGQRFAVRSVGDPRPPRSLQRALPWLIGGLAGLVTATVGAALVWWRSARVTRRLVEERTAKLAEAERSLRTSNEQLTDANRLAQELLAAVSHDVRTPLTVIGGLARTLEHRPEDPALVVEAVGRIGHQVTRLEAMIRDLLATTTGHDPSHASVERVDVVALTWQVVDNLDVGARVRAPDHLEVLAAPLDVERILDNLLANAARHGDPPFDVEVAHVDGVAQISVRDHGPGIDDEHLQTLFDPFHQVGRRKAGGIGLGLTIALRLARSNGGDLRYEPPTDGGARFVVELPLADGAGGSEGDPQADPEAGSEADPEAGSEADPDPDRPDPMLTAPPSSG